MLVSTVTTLINDVYRVAESGIWQDGAQRVTEAEVAGIVSSGELVVARSRGEIAGCPRLQRLDEERAEFGMLAADPAHRGTGIGRELVRFAERTSADNDAILMRLELLVPRTWRHPSKVFLKGWYERIGYELVRIGTIDESYPDLAPLLATACDFLVYTKKLV